MVRKPPPISRPMQKRPHATHAIAEAPSTALGTADDVPAAPPAASLPSCSPTDGADAAAKIAHRRPTTPPERVDCDEDEGGGAEGGGTESRTGSLTRAGAKVLDAAAAAARGEEIDVAARGGGGGSGGGGGGGGGGVYNMLTVIRWE